MNHIFRLRQTPIAGRPGPNQQPWDLESLRDSGISTILSVNNGEDCHQTRMVELGIRYANIPMSANAPAKPGDKELCLRNLPEALDFISSNRQSETVLIHCRSGKDRTALVMAAYLIAVEKLTARQAMDELLSIRPIAFSAEGWMEFCYEVLREFQIRVSGPVSTCW